MKRFILALVLGAFCTLANAGVIFTAVESDGDVIISASGPLDLTGLILLGTFPGAAGQIEPTYNGIWIGQSSPFDLYEGNILVPGTFGTGPITAGDTHIGEVVGVSARPDDDRYILTPNGYLSGESLSASTVWSNATFSSLGITEGTYIWTLPNDTLTLHVGAPVPIPAAAYLFGSALGLLGWMRRKKA